MSISSASIAADRRTYRDYAEARCAQYPSLMNLCRFMSNQQPEQHPCRITTLRFFARSSKPLVSTIDPRKLELEMLPRKSPGKELCNVGKGDFDNLLGEVVIVEDLTRDVVETLGSILEINPMFFAKHLPDQSLTFSDPMTPPSRSWSKGFINVFYHRVVSFSEEDAPMDLPLHFTRDSNVPRKVVVLPLMGKEKIGLVQHCCSLLMIARTNGTWLGLMLCDPPLERSYRYTRRGKNAINLKPERFMRGFEDFMEPKSFQDCSTRHPLPRYYSLQEDAESYWSTELPCCFDAKSPSLWSFANYPLRIIAQEWSRYVFVLYRCIKYFEYSEDETRDFLRGLQKLGFDLRLLQSWRRRILASQQKIDIVTRFIRAHGIQHPEDADVQEMLEDYTHLAKTMDTYGQRLENMLPIITSLVQIMDSRRSFAETANISRLTVLALVFVPLSFVAGLFSMGEETAPGGPHFWVYFVVAIPLTVVVFLIAHPQTLRTEAYTGVLGHWRNAFNDITRPPMNRESIVSRVADA